MITGQKVWTSLAHLADWCFVLARTEPGSKRSQGLSYLLVPMRQPGVTVRPIRQLTGTSEFNEVFFDGARTDAAHVVGEPGDGWRIAKATLAIERGAAMLGQQVGFRRELENLIDMARHTEAGTDPLLRDKLARAWIGLEVIRDYALDTLGGDNDTEASVLKILWSRWHQQLGELAMDVQGATSLTALPPGGTLCPLGTPQTPGAPAPRPGTNRTTWTNGSGSSCSAGPTRSTAGPTRSSGTSSPAAPSACRDHANS